MWSLPDLVRLNSEAAANRKRLERAVRSGELNGQSIRCEHADYDGDNCSGPISRESWFDIFSDTPKGLVHVCENHSPEEVVTRALETLAEREPPMVPTQAMTPAEAVADIRELRKGVTLGGLRIRNLINEGRKY